jgi:hypothetical protein
MDLDHPMGIRPARAHRSTSKILLRRLNAWTEVPSWATSRLSRTASAWSPACNAARAGVMNTDLHCGPTISRASRSASRRPSSGNPIGMSIATTASLLLVSAIATSSAIVAATHADTSWPSSMIPIHPALQASTPMTR